jgi:hypothetical protein
VEPPCDPTSWTDLLQVIKSQHQRLQLQITISIRSGLLPPERHQTLYYSQGQATEAVELAELTSQEFRGATEPVQAIHDIQDSLAYAQRRVRELEAGCRHLGIWPAAADIITTQPA